MSAVSGPPRRRPPASGGVDRRGLNPLWIRGLRSRGRLPHLLSWGVVTFTIAVFVSLMTYMTITERDLAPPADAAKAVLPGLIIIQAIALMMVGTSAVASGISRERDEGLLDYQRMTPMGPTSRIIGYLFGLPMREYLLFALTIPLVAAAVAKSGFSVATLAHFYAIFFLSVCVYHMTALTAGMISPSPRTATFLSVGLVAALYFVLPNLSHIGLTFFEYLTIRPTFFGLIEQELPESLRGSMSAARVARFRDVPFLNGSIHPTVYTVLVQGFLLGTLFSVVHRRWRNETSHLFSKIGAVVVFAGILFFLFGSVWAIVVQDSAHDLVFSRLRTPGPAERSLGTLTALLVIFTLIVGFAYLVVVTAATPDRSTRREGWRRARKLGRTRLAWNSDAASSLPAALVMIVLMLAAGGAILALIRAEGDYFDTAPAPAAVALAAAAITGIALVIQGLRERFGLRLFWMVLFLVWVIPFFAGIILVVAFGATEAAAYMMVPFPPATIVYALARLFETTVAPGGAGTGLVPHELSAEGPRLAATGALSYLAAGLLVQVVAWRHRAALRRMEMAPSGGA